MSTRTQSLLWSGLVVLLPLGIFSFGLDRADAAPRAKPTKPAAKPATDAAADTPATAAATPSAAPEAGASAPSRSAGAAPAGSTGAPPATGAPAATGAPPTDRPAEAPSQLQGATAGPKEEAARAHYGRAVDQYLQGNYANAWLEFSSAYQITPLTALLNNMARCEVKIGRPGEALQHFRRFLAATPDDPDGEYIRQEIARLEAELGRRAAPVESGPDSGDPLNAPAAPRRVPVYAIAAGATTLAALIAGGVALATVAGRYNTLDVGCKPGCPPLDVANLQQVSNAGYGLLGAAVVPAILTVVALRFELGRHSETTLRPLAGLRLTNPLFVFGSN